jgi:hypothetical protein
LAIGSAPWVDGRGLALTRVVSAVWGPLTQHDSTSEPLPFIKRIDLGPVGVVAGVRFDASHVRVDPLEKRTASRDVTTSARRNDQPARARVDAKGRRRLIGALSRLGKVLTDGRGRCSPLALPLSADGHAATTAECDILVCPALFAQMLPSVRPIFESCSPGNKGFTGNVRCFRSSMTGGNCAACIVWRI